MAFADLREWLEAVERSGELKYVSGASWDLEMNSISEVVSREGREPKPALMFDDIPGYPRGYRTLFGLLSSNRRIAQTLSLPEGQTDRMSLVQNWRKKSRELHSIPPKLVQFGKVQANLLKGGDIDLLKFPVPRFHELDRNRYIGTGHTVIQRDPETGWVNLGTYRIMVADRDRLTLHAAETQHGYIIMQKYFDQGNVMPIAIAIGVDPALWWASCQRVRWGLSEYDYTGGIRGEPIEVIEGSETGLPLPAHAEIVIEGECHPGEVAEEGPFGEWHGYYANRGLSTVLEPVIRVKAIYYREHPILTCTQTSVPPNELTLMNCISYSAGIWNRLEDLGVLGIKGVWCSQEGNGVLFNVVSIEQLYSGHAREVGLIAAQYAKEGRYTIVVEEDIDATNMGQVIWALVTRSVPEQSIQILHHCHASSSDPLIPLEEKQKYPPKSLTSSRVIIDACRALEWEADWYPIARMSPELRAKIVKKWQSVLSGIM